jgi:predicted nucleic acid-binding protein
MSDVVFVDSNILVYAYDADAGRKRERAEQLLRQLWDSGAGRLSVQVLQEFYVNVTRKLPTPLAHLTAREIVGSYGAWVREPTTPLTVMRAVDIAAMAHIHFWDALIVASAEQAEATNLYSEDLSSGQSIAGVKIIDPFLQI